MKSFSALFICLTIILGHTNIASAESRARKAFSKLTVQHPETILLRNVSLIDPDNPALLRKVNILIKYDQLDVVTEDLIPLAEAEISYDARGGVVLGQLVLGETASFMILDGDPAKM